MPEAFPGFSPDAPSKCPALAPQQAHDGSRFDSRLFAMPLPQTSPPNSSRPHSPSCARPNPVLRVIHIQLRQTLTELHNLSFASDTPPDALAVIGASSSACVPRPYGNCKRISAQMEKLAGVQSRLGHPRARHQNRRSEPTTPQRAKRGVIPSRRSRGSHAPERSVAVSFLATSAHPGFSLCDSYTLSNIPVQILYSFSGQREAYQKRYINDYI